MMSSISRNVASRSQALYLYYIFFLDLQFIYIYIFFFLFLLDIYINMFLLIYQNKYI